MTNLFYSFHVTRNKGGKFQRRPLLLYHNALSPSGLYFLEAFLLCQEVLPEMCTQFSPLKCCKFLSCNLQSTEELSCYAPVFQWVTAESAQTKIWQKTNLHAVYPLIRGSNSILAIIATQYGAPGMHLEVLENKVFPNSIKFPHRRSLNNAKREIIPLPWCFIALIDLFLDRNTGFKEGPLKRTETIYWDIVHSLWSNRKQMM